MEHPLTKEEFRKATLEYAGAKKALKQITRKDSDPDFLEEILLEFLYEMPLTPLPQGIGARYAGLVEEKLPSAKFINKVNKFTAKLLKAKIPDPEVCRQTKDFSSMVIGSGYRELLEPAAALYRAIGRLLPCLSGSSVLPAIEFHKRTKAFADAATALQQATQTYKKRSVRRSRPAHFEFVETIRRCTGHCSFKQAAHLLTAAYHARGYDISVGEESLQTLYYKEHPALKKNRSITPTVPLEVQQMTDDELDAILRRK